MMVFVFVTDVRLCMCIYFVPFVFVCVFVCVFVLCIGMCMMMSTGRCELIRVRVFIDSILVVYA